MPYLPFVAIDVETANYDCTNICQFGFATFLDGALHEKNAYLVNPECDFEPQFKRIHGITPEMVARCPTWPAFLPAIVECLNAATVLSHTFFDKDAIGKACLRYKVPRPMPTTWVDTCSLARRVWPNLENHKLPTLAKCFAINYRAHDAAEDARCAGEIFLLAVRDSGKTMQQIIKKYSMWWPDVDTVAIRTVTVRATTAPKQQLSTADLKRAEYARITAERAAALTSDEQLDIRHMWHPQPVESSGPSSPIEALPREPPSISQTNELAPMVPPDLRSAISVPPQASFWIRPRAWALILILLAALTYLICH